MRPCVTTLIAFAILPLGGCSLEGFDVTPCQSGETVGFAIAPIEGVFSDYQPRPSDIWMRPQGDPKWDDAATWAAVLPMNGPDDETYHSRPSHKLITYGQPLAGWTVEHPPKPLEKGV
ncbi:MAG: hypothetical protein KAF27_11470, partial [Porphyrobacter sp.]|nr:hypothetical protein [Porphyrobacter sp.]